MDTDDYKYGGWLVAVRGPRPPVIYAATFETPEEAIEAVSAKREGQSETYEAVGRFLSEAEVVRDIPASVAVPLND